MTDEELARWWPEADLIQPFVYLVYFKKIRDQSVDHAFPQWDYWVHLWSHLRS